MKALDFILRGFLFMVFFSQGLGHFLETDFYLKMMPPYIPYPVPVVLFTGFCEALMAIFVLIPETKKYAARAMVVFLLAYLPALFYMLTNTHLFPEIARQLLIISFPVHIMLIVMCWYLSEWHSPIYYFLKLTVPEELESENQPPKDEEDEDTDIAA
jgi:uncharacterized membrane protein